MADKKISGLSAKTTPVGADQFVLVDSAANETKKVTYTNLTVALLASLTPSIDHNALTNTHNLTTDIDHDALTNFAANEHFTEASIDHGNLEASSLGDDDHPHYALADGSRDITGGQAFDKYVYSKQGTETQVASAAHTIDWDDGNSTVWDLEAATGAITLTLSNPKAGASYLIKIIQGSTARDITWPATVLWPGGVAPVISVAENAIDVVCLYWDGANYLGTFNQAFA